MTLPTTLIRWLRRGSVFIPALVILGAWQGLVEAHPRYEFFLGSPTGIWREALRLWKNGQLLHHAGITASEALLGFLLGTLIGTGLGLALWASHLFLEVSKPYLMALGALPVFALGPVLIFWFGTGMWSKIILAFLSTLVIAVMQAHAGAEQAEANLQNVVRAFGGTRMQVFSKVVAPASTVWVLSGIRVNIGMALLGAFIGEFIASQAGLGHVIIVAEGLFNVDLIWVGVIGIMAIALFLQALATPAEHWARRWR